MEDGKEEEGGAQEGTVIFIFIRELCASKQEVSRVHRQTMIHTRRAWKLMGR
jgi:hypothetical protein